MSIVEQNIMDALEDLLETITVANGYNSNIGSNVEVWRTIPYNESELPALNIRDIRTDTETIISEGANSKADFLMDVQIAVIGKGSDTAENIKKYVADVDTALGSDSTLSGLVHWIRPVSVSVGIEDKSFRSGERLRDISIYYRKGLWG